MQAHRPTDVDPQTYFVGLTLKLLEIIVGYYSRDMEDPIVEVI
jgi:hypothetical protein